MPLKVVRFVHEGTTYNLVSHGSPLRGWDIYSGSPTPENWIAWTTGTVKDARNTVRDMARNAQASNH